ncbi:hypothetical protein FKW77_004024 [Venturia effusa]|uniref:Uncharacterized protein n=1 Tax=Venturia effusa TaxID=50376 RepID=A0A517LF95_9PEZI|nr:hypothetical protein FKW77_004024 [Venturia effusa]
MSNTSLSAKKILERSDPTPTMATTALPGQSLIPAPASSRSDRLPGSAVLSPDLRSEVKSFTYSKPPSLSRLTLSSHRMPSKLDHRSSSHRLQSVASTMSPPGYLGGTASSNLKSKIPRSKLNPHSKPDDQGLAKCNTQQLQPQDDVTISEAAVSPTSGNSSTEIPRHNDPIQIPLLADNRIVTVDATQSSTSEGSDSFSVAASDESEHQRDALLPPSHEDDLAQQGNWDEVTLLDIVQASDSNSLHNALAKIVDPDFTQSTHTLVSEGDYGAHLGRSITFRDDTEDLSPKILGTEFDDPFKPASEVLRELDGKAAQELLIRLKAAEEQIASLSAESEERRKRVDETEDQLYCLRENTDRIIRNAELKAQEHDALISLKEAETSDLLVQLHNYGLALQELEAKYRLKCDECNDLTEGSHFQHPSEHERDLVIEELARTRVEHERAFEAAEARFQTERDEHAEIVKGQDEIIQDQDVLVVQLETTVAQIREDHEAEVEGIREDLYHAQGRAALKDELLRQQDDDFAVFQDAYTTYWRREYDMGKPARREIKRLELEVQVARTEIKTVKAEAKRTKEELESDIKYLEADDTALREELWRMRYHNECLEWDAAREAEEKARTKKEVEKLRFQLAEAEDKVKRYEILGPVDTDFDFRDRRPVKRLSETAILASADITLLTDELSKAFSKIRCYEVLGVSNTDTPIEEREMEVIARETEVVNREMAAAEKEMEVEKAAGAARVEVIVLRDVLETREREIRELNRIVAGLRDDLRFQRHGPWYGEVFEETDSEEEEGELRGHVVGLESDDDEEEEEGGEVNKRSWNLILDSFSGDEM